MGSKISILGERKAVKPGRKLDTKGNCFFCLETVGEGNDGSSVSLKNIRRFLQMELKYPTTFGGGGTDGGEIEVDVCETCDQLYKQFSELFKDLKNVLGELTVRMEEAKRIPELLQNYSNKPGAFDTETLSHFAAVDALRKSLQKKSLYFTKTRDEDADGDEVAVKEKLTDGNEEAEDDSQWELLMNEDISVFPEDEEVEEQSSVSSPMASTQNGNDNSNDPNVSSTQVSSSLGNHFPRNPETNLVHCPTCNKGFDYNYRVKIHYESVHLGQKNYKKYVYTPSIRKRRCQGQQREQQDKVEKRVKQKKDNLPFPCTTCGKTFSKRVQLSQDKVHGAKFACEDCGKSFQRSGRLKAHMATRQKMENFSCSTCGKNFSQKQSCAQHEKGCKEKNGSKK